MSALPHKPLTRLALIQLDSVVLGLSTSDVQSVELVPDVKPPRDGRSAGSVELEGKSWPVYCPTDDLGAARDMSDEHRICAMLTVNDGLFGLLCREVIRVGAENLRTFKLPDCMRTPNIPLHSVGMLGTQIVFLTSARSLYSLFTSVHANSSADVIETRSHGNVSPATSVVGRPA